MLSRRELLQAAALSALPVAAGATGLAATSPSRPSRPALHSVLVDPRLPQARDFGEQFAGRGVPRVDATEDNITALWLAHVRPVWSQAPAAIAGLTPAPVLFCLEQFAWMHGLRVVFHSEHVVHAGGATEHRLLHGAGRAALTTHDLHRSGSAWSGHLARAIARHRGTPGNARSGPSAAALAPAMPPGARLLAAWIIAPA